MSITIKSLEASEYEQIYGGVCMCKCGGQNSRSVIYPPNNVCALLDEETCRMWCEMEGWENWRCV